MAPLVHGLADRVSDPAAIANIGWIKQPGFDESMKVVVVQPDRNQLLNPLGRRLATAGAVQPSDDPWLRPLAQRGGRSCRLLKPLTADKGGVEAGDLSTEGNELATHPCK